MKPNLLLSEHLDSYPLVDSYHPMDTLELYLANSAGNSAFEQQWPRGSVTYTTNRDHYRCPEWEQIQWADSILVLGCSCTFGVGIDDADTVASQLARRLSRPVINLGVAAASWLVIWTNTVRLIQAGIKPPHVVYIWPETSRYARLLPGGLVRHYGPWNIDLKGNQLGREYALAGDHAALVAQDQLASVRALWTCPQLHYSWSRAISPDWTVTPLADFVDHARDLVHPGPATVGLWVDRIADDLASLGS